MNGQKFPYAYECSTREWEDQIRWLEEHYGDIGIGWDYYKVRFYFKTEQDRTMFGLRWPR